MDTTGHYWLSLVTFGYLLLLNTTGYYWLLLVITGYYWLLAILQKCEELLPGEVKVRSSLITIKTSYTARVWRKVSIAMKEIQLLSLGNLYKFWGR